jgi:hypothetical protein
VNLHSGSGMCIGQSWDNSTAAGAASSYPRCSPAGLSSVQPRRHYRGTVPVTVPATATQANRHSCSGITLDKPVREMIAKFARIAGVPVPGVWQPCTAIGNTAAAGELLRRFPRLGNLEDIIAILWAWRQRQAHIRQLQPVG